MKKNLTIQLIIFVGVVLLGVGSYMGYRMLGSRKMQTPLVARNIVAPNVTPAVVATPTPSVSPTPTPVPLPDPKVYGPCKNIPVLFWHHIQPWEDAESKNQKNLTVKNDVFSTQMDYLAKRGYHTLTPDELVSGLSSGLPARSVLLTFDDGYADFSTYAYPELVKHNFRATMFLPTGLVGGADYLTWSQISEMHSGGLVTFADHTWSHKSLGKATEEVAKYEVDTAKNQLEEHGLGPVTAFAYPYGTEGGSMIYGVLKDAGIKEAFTTIPGSYQCVKLPFDLRRTRVGNAALSSYGL